MKGKDSKTKRGAINTGRGNFDDFLCFFDRIIEIKIHLNRIIVHFYNALMKN